MQHEYYTPSVAVALAESAGFVDVTTETYKDNPDLTYNLIVRGKKPCATYDELPIADEVDSFVEEMVCP